MITAKYGIAGLQVATLMAGIILLLMGLARMGSVIKFIPAPVIVGFTAGIAGIAGIAVIIFVGQWDYFLGLPKVAGEHFHEKVWHLLQVLPEAHWPTAALAALSLLLVIYSPRIWGLSKIPGPLVAMVVATLVHVAFDPPGVATIGTAFGGIPAGLPPDAVGLLDTDTSAASA